jgi:hypothetical protein
MKCLFRYSLQLLFTTFLILRGIQEYMNVYWSSCKIPVILLTWRIGWAPNNASRWQMGFNSVFEGLIKLEFSWQIFEKFSNISFHKNQSSGNRFLRCGRTDGYDEANSRFFQFCEWALKTDVTFKECLVDSTVWCFLHFIRLRWWIQVILHSKTTLTWKERSIRALSRISIFCVSYS